MRGSALAGGILKQFQRLSETVYAGSENPTRQREGDSIMNSEHRSVSPAYLIGLDLGQTQDFSALAVLEQTVPAEPCGLAPPEYALRHLRRFPLGTAYTEIFSSVAAITAKAHFAVLEQTDTGTLRVNGAATAKAHFAL
jgi:hypothetical protein